MWLRKKIQTNSKQPTQLTPDEREYVKFMVDWGKAWITKETVAMEHVLKARVRCWKCQALVNVIDAAHIPKQGAAFLICPNCNTIWWQAIPSQKKSPGTA
jgi:hypothetical protein